MQPKRIIPCLDIKDGRVVKGINFIGLTDAGDPVECAKEYESQGADELVLLDISASVEGRKTIYSLVEMVAKEISIPLTVGGGISTFEDIEKVLSLGASKVSINSTAVKNPNLIRQGADGCGSKSIVVAVDVRKNSHGLYTVFVNGGKVDTGLDALQWIEQVERLGAGEILLTSMDADGTKSGFDLEITEKAAKISSLPIIASGGGGELKHFKDVFSVGADAALAASIFHFKKYTVGHIKEYLSLHFPLRLNNKT